MSEIRAWMRFDSQRRYEVAPRAKRPSVALARSARANRAEARAEIRGQAPTKAYAEAKANADNLFKSAWKATRQLPWYWKPLAALFAVIVTLDYPFQIVRGTVFGTLPHPLLALKDISEARLYERLERREKAKPATAPASTLPALKPASVKVTRG